MEKSGKLGESDGRTENKGGNKRNEGQRKGYYALEEVTRGVKNGEKRKKEGEKWTTSGKQG